MWGLSPPWKILIINNICMAIDNRSVIFQYRPDLIDTINLPHKSLHYSSRILIFLCSDLTENTSHMMHGGCIIYVMSEVKKYHINKHSLRILPK